jgi:hypothetical protein
VSILWQLDNLHSSAQDAFVVFIIQLDLKTIFVQSMGLRQLMIGLVKHHLQFSIVFYLPKIQTMRRSLHIQITLYLKSTIKNLLAYYPLHVPLMVYPWMLTLNINYHFLMTMISTIMATTTTWTMIFLVVTVIAPLLLFRAVLGHSMFRGHMDINKQLWVIHFLGEFTMTNSMVSL